MVSDHELSVRRQQAVHFAREQHLSGGAVWHNLCQKFVRTACGADPGAPSARSAWVHLPGGDKHGVGGKHPPAGVPVYFWLNTPFWHAALSAGKGYIWSTDILRRGHVDKVSIPYLEHRWNARYLGWAESVNQRRMWPS